MQIAARVIAAFRCSGVVIPPKDEHAQARQCPMDARVIVAFRCSGVVIPTITTSLHFSNASVRQFGKYRHLPKGQHKAGTCVSSSASGLFPSPPKATTYQP